MLAGKKSQMTRADAKMKCSVPLFLLDMNFLRTFGTESKFVGENNVWFSGLLGKRVQKFLIKKKEETIFDLKKKKRTIFDYKIRKKRF